MSRIPKYGIQRLFLPYSSVLILRKVTEPNHDVGYLPVEDRTVPAVDNTVKQEGSRLVSEAGTEGGR